MNKKITFPLIAILSLIAIVSADDLLINKYTMYPSNATINNFLYILENGSFAVVNITSITWDSGNATINWSNGQSFISPNLTGPSGANGDALSDGNNYTTSIGFTGTTTKTLNLAMMGRNNITASFTDTDTTYSAGTGITLTSTTFNINETYLNNLFNETTYINNIITSIGNWSADKIKIQNNITNINATANAKALPGTATCTENTVAQNVTTTTTGTTSQCKTITTGTITSIITTNPINGGTITTTGTISFNDTYANNKWNDTTYINNKFGTLTDNKWCIGDGGKVVCEQTTPATVTSVTDVDNRVTTINQTVTTHTSQISGIQGNITSIGNWSVDKQNYINQTYANATYGELATANEWTGYNYFNPSTNTSFNNIVMFYGAVYFLNNITMSNVNAMKVNNSIVLTDISGSQIFNVSDTNGGTARLWINGNISASNLYNKGEIDNQNSIQNNSITNIDNKYTSVGNWSADKSSYTLLTYTQSIGNWSADKANVLANITSANATANLMCPKTGCTYTGNVAIQENITNVKMINGSNGVKICFGAVC